ncbi:MAG: heme exporter protein CcmD [Kangiellaceae bacterium]|nr:heme exporter protein CcmD [Kangiellaceae bacterium]
MNGWANSLQEFLAMGKHGDYVWASYGMTLLVFVLLFVWFRYMLKSLRSQVQSRLQTDDQEASSAKARKLKVDKA